MWFTETPWPPIVLCGVAAAILLAAWYQNRRGGLLIAAIAMLPLAAGIFFLERAYVSEAERIEANVYGLTTAFQQGDSEKTLDFLAADAQLERELVAKAIGLVEVQNDLRITDLRVRMMSADSRAVSHFRANATVKYLGHEDRARTRWELTWQRIGGDWKVIHIRRLKLLEDREMNPMDPTE